MKFTDAQLALRLFNSGLNVPTIATLIGCDRDEVEQAIDYAETHGQSHLTSDNDDWRSYATA